MPTRDGICGGAFLSTFAVPDGSAGLMSFGSGFGSGFGSAGLARSVGGSNFAFCFVGPFFGSEYGSIGAASAYGSIGPSFGVSFFLGVFFGAFFAGVGTAGTEGTGCAGWAPATATNHEVSAIATSFFMGAPLPARR